MLNATYVITENGIVLMLNGKHQQIPQDHLNYTKISNKLLSGDYEGLEDLMDARAAVRKWLGNNPRFRLNNDLLELDGRAFSDAITGKVLSMIDAGNNPGALINFLVKVRQNPSRIAQEELLLFCIANGFMIHEDGDILAYKSVQDSWMDMHSGTVFNKPAHLMTEPERLQYAFGVQSRNGVTVKVVNGRTTVSMERNAVDDNRDQVCSYGLHFAAHEYAQSFGSGVCHMLLLKLSPSDVVSIPSDYNNQKGRCAKYVVEAEIENRQPLPQKEVYNDSDYRDEDDWSGVTNDWSDEGDTDCQCDPWSCDCEGDCDGECDCDSHDCTNRCEPDSRYCADCGRCHT